MFNAIGFLIKLALFSALVLVIGNWIRWDGKTMSDQVRTGVSAVERSEMLSGVKSWAGGLVGDARGGAARARKAAAQKGDAEEDVVSSERQKLRALIRELNSAK